MMKRVSLVLGVAFALAMGASAAAQWSGQGDGPGGHRRGRRGDSGGPPAGSDSGAPHRRDPAPRPPDPSQVVITGVVKALGPEPDRVTIAYDAVEALNWPAGTTPFVVTNTALLSGVAIGQKVRFKIESAHIYELERLP